MFKLFRIKRYGYVDLGSYASRDAALIALTHITFIRTAGENRFFCEDGYTYEIKRVC